jgi:hypothetical protein
MAQAVLAYAAVSAAAGWTVWSILLPTRLREAVAARFTRRPSVAKAGGCDCGGGCRD